MYKRLKKSTVQLTSLLDLLFVMIFVSLIQQKTVTQAPETKAPPAPVPTVAAAPSAAPTVAATVAPIATPTHYSVQAKFKFYATSENPSLPTGIYLMQGSYDLDSGKLQLGGLSWIQRPPNYDMVPLSGIINGNLETFVGRIEFQGCEKFTLQRTKKGIGSPISGEWSGTYDCTQGATGLTLTID